MKREKEKKTHLQLKEMNEQKVATAVYDWLHLCEIL